MKKTKLQDTINTQCREVLRIAAEQVGKPTMPVVDDYTEIVDPAAYYTGYPTGEVTYQESLVAGQSLKKLLSYMSLRAENEDSELIKQTVLELILEASKIYSHIKLNEKPKVKENE